MIAKCLDGIFIKVYEKEKKKILNWSNLNKNIWPMSTIRDNDIQHVQLNICANFQIIYTKACYWTKEPSMGQAVLLFTLFHEECPCVLLGGENITQD